MSHPLKQRLQSFVACKKSMSCITALKLLIQQLWLEAELSHRYITDRFLPDKAIDLIDEATILALRWKLTASQKR
jgi:ATP-dependent Clp protease ATP-binding subunit ClpA